MGLPLTPFLILLSALLLYYLFSLYQALGLGRVVYDHYPGPCRVVEGIEFGAEKIITLSNGIAIMTSGYQMKGFHDTSVIKDPGLYMFDFKEPSKNVSRLKFSSNYDPTVSSVFVSLYKIEQIHDLTLK